MFELTEKDPIEKLTDELFVYHGLKTETEREVLREMARAVFVDETYKGIAGKLGPKNGVNTVCEARGGHAR
jgi:hypothetical protein